MVRKLCILLMLAGILAAAGALMFFAQTPEGKALVVDNLQDFVHERTGLMIMVGDVEVDPWRPSLELVDVRVDGKGAPRMAGVHRLHIALAPLQLLSGSVVVDQMDVAHPYLNLRVKDGKIVGLPPLPKPESDDGPKDLNFFRLLVKTFRLTGAEVKVRVEGEHPVTVALHDLRAKLEVEGSDLHAGAFALGRGVITLPNGQRAMLRELAGRAVLQGDGLLRPEQLNIETAQLQLDGIHGTTQGTVRFAPFSSALIPAVDLELAGHVPVGQFPKWFPQLWPMGGTVDVNAHVRSAFGGRNPSAVGHGVLKGIEIGPFIIGNASGDFVADMTGVDFTGVKSDFASGDIQGEGRIDFGKEVTAKFNATGHGASFGEGMAAIGVKGAWVDFDIDAEIEFEGELYPNFAFAGFGRTDVTNLKVFTQSYKTATAENMVFEVGPVHGESAMEFDFTHFGFVQGKISDGKTSVTGDVYLPFNLDEDFVVTATADPDKRPGEAFDCATMSPIAGINLQCRGPGNVTVKGRYYDPKIWGGASLRDVAVQGYNIGDAKGSFDYHNLLLRFLDVKGQKNRTRYEGEAALNWRAYLGQGPDGKPLGRPRTQRDTLHVTVAARNVNGYAEDIRSVIPPGWGSVMEYLRTLPLEGPVRGRADARGAVGDATVDDLTFEADFQMRGITLYGQEFDGEHIRAHMDHKQFHFDDLTLTRGPSTWHAEGTIGRADAALHVDASIKDMPLALLNVLEGAGQPVHGRFDATVNARGAVGDWHGPVGLDLHEASYGDIPVGSGRLDLMMMGDRIVGSGPLFDGRAALDWNMKLEPPWQFSAQLKAERGPAQDLIGMNTLPKGVTLTFGGLVQAEGALSEADKTRGAVTLKRTTLTYKELAARADGDVKFRFNGPRVELERFLFVTDDGSKVELKGQATTRALDLDLELSSDLRTARIFMPSLKESSGPMGLSLGISGTPSEPILVGQGRLSEGRLVVDGFPHAFRNIEANISFIRDRIVLDPILLDLDQSPMKGHAEVQLKGFGISHITFTSRFQDLRFKVPDYLPSRLSGTITMTGTPDNMMMLGDVDVLEARYLDSWDWENYVKDLQRRRLAPRVYDKEAEWLNFDVHLRADDKIYVQNNTMDAEFRGDLHLTGTNERVGLIGTLTALGGRAIYRNNTYELGRSTVDFVDRNKVTPVLDVEARTRIKNYDILVEVEGRPEDLSAERGIRLSSRPDLPMVDVLSLVLVGFTQNDLNTAAAAGGAGGVASAALGGGLDWLTSATGVDKEVRRAVPKQVVDEFYLTSRTPRSANGAVLGSVPALVVGTDISSILPGGRLRLTTSIINPSGNSSDQSVELEQRWGDHVSGRLVWDRSNQLQTYGDAGGDLRFRWEF